MIRNQIRRNERSVILLLITVLLTLLFITPISYELGVIGGSIVIDSLSFYTFFIVTVCLVLYLYIPKITNVYIFSRKISFAVFYFSIIYFYLRFFDPILKFAPYHEVLKFSDVLFLIFTLHSIVILRLFWKENILLKKSRDSSTMEKNPFFLQDTLFYDQEIDNEKILIKLTDTLNDFKPINSFSVGLNAVWGYGKSSFLKKFEKVYSELNPKSIIFWNHIWKNKGSQAIIENFFNELKENLKPFSSTITNEIDQYVEAILSLGQSDISNLVSMGSNFINGNETLEGNYIEINKTIKVIDRQIIILLDDLDRLEKEEILSTLKLIRTISDFNNVIFIAGYDRKYIVDTIADSNSKYLDKIFNVEINLLPFDEELITDELIRQIEAIYSRDESKVKKKGLIYGFKNLFKDNNDELTQELEFSLNESKKNSSDYSLSYSDFLNTYRDVKRFVNEFRFNFTFLEAEETVIAEEYILLKLCSYKYRSLHNDVFSNLKKFLSVGIIDEVNDEIKQFGGLSNYNVYLYDEKAKEKLKKIISTYPSEDQIIINSVLCKLFSKRHPDFYLVNQNSISKIYYTDIYVRNNLVAGQISVTQLQNAYEKGEIYKIAEKLSQSTEQSKFHVTNELKQFIFNNSSVSTKERFIDILKTLNFIIVYNTIKDDERISEIIGENRKKFYENNDDAFSHDIIQILKVLPLGYLDKYFKEILFDLIRYKNEDKSGNSLQKIILSEVELKTLLHFKLTFLIDNKNSPELITKYYNFIPHIIINDTLILRSKKANSLIQEDIIKRFPEYLNTDLFKFYTGNIEEASGNFIGYSPNLLLAQIFASPQKYDALVNNPHNINLLKDFMNEGFQNVNKHIQEMNIPYNKIEKDIQTKMKDFSRVFTDKNFIPLEKGEYENIDLPF